MARVTLAVMDIGSNSVKLTVAGKDGNRPIQVLTDKTTITRLGKDVTASGELDADAMARTLEVMREYADEARTLGASRIVAVGTSALRQVRNNQPFINEAEQIVGSTGSFEVISGMREAKLIFNGARRDPDLHLPAHNPSAVMPTVIVTMDIGGGSTEVVMGYGEAVSFQESLPLGAVRLTEQALPSDPTTPDEVANAVRMADAALKEIPTAASEDLAPQVILVGSGGTIVNLAAISLGKPLGAVPVDQLHGTTLTRDRIQDISDYLATHTVADRQKLPGLEPDRADVLLAGAIIQTQAMRRLGVDSVHVSVRGLRFGLLYELFDYESEW